MSAEERELLVGRLHRWANKPNSKVHKMIALVVHSDPGISRDELVRLIHRVTGSKNAYGALAALLTSNGNAYGRVLTDQDGRIVLHPDLADEIGSLVWHKA